MMRVSANVVGKMKAGPEKELADRYLERFARAAPPLGIEFAGVNELTESRAASSDERKRDEAERLRAAIGDGAVLICLDERGKSIGSDDFAQRLARWRDDGARTAALVIGGPDGLDPALRQEARLVVSFGAMTWPHQLVRIMLAEQLYRAATILSGHPYHRV